MTTNVKAKVLAYIDDIPDDRQDMVLLGLELLAYAKDDRPVPARLRTAVAAERWEHARQQAEAEEAAQPAPAERYPDIPLGTIDDCPVTGHYAVDDGYPLGKLFSASLIWCGLKISTDGVDYLNFNTTGDGCGDMTLHEWGRIRELAQTTVVEQLITLARSKATLSEAQLTAQIGD